MPEDHRLVGQAGTVDLEELSNSETFVTSGGAFPDTMMSISSALSNKMQGCSRLSATNMSVAASLVRETGVLAIIDPFSAEQAVNMGGVVFRPIAQDLKYYVSIVTSGREQLSRQAIELAEVLAQQITARVACVMSYAD
jgi:DNA-binding transcriptional LysR family regulator